jgi:hypothetical protein
MSTLRPKAFYLIKNVEQATFLESPTDQRLVLRSKKNDSKLQQWTFVQDKNGYKIMASPGDRYVGVDGDPPRVKAGREVAHIWTATPIGNGDVWSLSYRSGGKRHFLTVSSNGNLELGQKTDSSMWKIVEVWPTLPSSTYRIWGLSGIVLTMPTASSVVGKVLDKGSEDQLWEVQPHVNGLHWIKSVKHSVFLSTNDEGNQLSFPSKRNESPDWKVDIIGGFVYSISQRDGARALSISNDNQIILKSSQSAHNKIWFIEQTDVTEVAREKKKAEDEAKVAMLEKEKNAARAEVARFEKATFCGPPVYISNSSTGTTLGHYSSYLYATNGRSDNEKFSITTDGVYRRFTIPSANYFANFAGNSVVNGRYIYLNGNAAVNFLVETVNSSQFRVLDSSGAFAWSLYSNNYVILAPVNRSDAKQIWNFSWA